MMLTQAYSAMLCKHSTQPGGLQIADLQSASKPYQRQLQAGAPVRQGLRAACTPSWQLL